MWDKVNDGHPNQTYEIFHNKDGTFTFKTKVTNYDKCLEVKGGWFGVGGEFSQYTCNGTLAQKFIILEKDDSGRQYIESKSEYSENGDYKLKDINEREKFNIYSYNNQTGTLTTTMDAKGKTTSYEYDNMNKVTKITNGNTINNFGYDKNKLISINHNGFSYNFGYDEFGNTSTTKVEGQTLITNTYESKNGNLLKNIYGNGHEINYTYDKFDRVKTKKSNNETINYTYDNRGNLGRIENGSNKTDYTYDLSGRLIKYKYNDFQTDYVYNKYNELDQVNYEVNGIKKNNKYTYDIDGKLTKLNDIKYSYDKLDRLTKKNIGNYNIKYAYQNINEDKTTNVIKSITNGTDKILYTYDDNGNIETIKENDKLVNDYEYDNLNQLVKEQNVDLNKTIVYTYDSGGNLLSKKYYNYKTEALDKEKNYSYENSNWKDQLTKYDNKTITYDEIGNPLTYGNIAYTWKNGRELSTYTDGNTNISYQYNEDGIRVSKKVNNDTYKYYLEDSDIIFEERPEGTIYYDYDTDGISGFEYKDKKYYYIKNQQSDIIGILDSNKNKVVTYRYDSWGKVISVLDSNNKEITDKDNIANINPFRYRSYYYDTETQLYYLNSRYYNPDMGRFINADGIMGANKDDLGYNLYAYVSNNSVNAKDSNGNWVQFVVGAILIGSVVYDTYQALKNPTKGNIATAAIGFMPGGKGASTGWKVASGVFKTTGKKAVTKTVKGSASKQAYKVEIPKLTNKEVKEYADKLGFNKVKDISHGQSVFKKGNKYISYDWDIHNGGFWKMANAPENLTKSRRMGTYNMDLTERIKK